MGVAPCYADTCRWMVASCGWMLLLVIATLPSGSTGAAVALAYVLPRSALESSYPTLRPIFGGVLAAIAFFQNGSFPSPQVVLLPGTHTGSNSTDFSLPNGFTLRGALPIEVAGGGRAIIDCAYASQRAFTLAEASCVVANLTVRRCGGDSVRGGAVVIYGVRSRTNTFSGVNFEDNTAMIGGALCIVGDSLKTFFNDCIFKSNSASLQGGTIFVLAGNTTLTRCTLFNGTAPEAAGVFIHAGLVKFVDSSILNCTSQLNTVVVAISSNLIMSGGSVRHNVATTSGAAGPRVEVSECDLSGVLFDNNNALDNAGGLLLTGDAIGPQNIKNCTFSNNRSGNKGGGIFTARSMCVITNSVFFRNIALTGGGIDMQNTQTVTGCTFRENTAIFQGGGLNTEGTTTLSNSKFYNNRAGTFGGGVAIRLGKTTVTGSLFVGNNAPQGGALGVPSELVVSGTNFSGNTAQYGGALYFEKKGTISKVFFTNNSANIAGGAIYRLSAATVTTATVNNTQNSAPYGGDRATNAVSMVVLRLPDSPSTAIFNRTSAKPEQNIRLVVRVLDAFGQQVTRFTDTPLLVDLLPMFGSRRIGAVTNFLSSSIIGGQSIVDLAVAGVVSDTVPVNFTIISSVKLQATLLVFIDNCSDTEHRGADPKQLHEYPICIPNVVWTLQEVSMGLTYGVLGMVALLLVLFLLLLLFVCVKVKLQLIKSASRIFLFGFLGWNMVLAAAAVGVSFQPSAPLCLVRAWLFFLGAFGVLTLLLAKVVSISRKRYDTTQINHSRNDTWLYLVAFASNLLMLTLLIVWFVLNPPLPTRMDTSEENRTYMMTCGENLTGQWPFLFSALGLLGVSGLLAVLFAFRARNVIMPFSETRYAVFSAYAAFALLVVFVPLVAFLGNQPDYAALLASLGQLIASGTVVGFIVGQKVFIWKFPPVVDETTQSFVGGSAWISTAVATHSQASMASGGQR